MNSRNEKCPRIFSKFSIRNCIFLLVNLFFLIHCYSGKAIQLDDEVNRASMDDNAKVRIYEFGESEKFGSIVLFSPVFWKDEFLWDDKESLIPYLIYRGYKVYLITWKDSNVDSKILFKSLESILRPITTGISNSKGSSQNSSQSNIYLGGISTGGQKLAEILSIYSPNKFPNLRKVFFLGTGFDYNYPKSFYEQSLVLRESKKIEKNSFAPRLFLDKDYFKYATGNTSTQKLSPGLNPEYFVDSNIAFGFFWGKIDSVSPEESIHPYYQKIKKRNPELARYFEFSIANGKSIDFDHGYLIRGIEARKNVFPVIVDWLQSFE